MNLREFCDRLDRCEFADIHYVFFDKLAPHFAENIYSALIERASWLLRLKDDINTLTELYELYEKEYSQTAALPTWVYFYTLLREIGQDPEKLTLEEALLLIAKHTKPYNYEHHK